MRLADLPVGARMVGERLERSCPWCRRIPPSLRLHAGRTTRIVPVAEITLLRAAEKELEVWTAEGLRGLLRASLGGMESTYPGVWTRVHRCALVDLGAVLRVIRVANRRRHGRRFIVVAGRLWPVVRAALDGG